MEDFGTPHTKSGITFLRFYELHWCGYLSSRAANASRLVSFPVRGRMVGKELEAWAKSEMNTS